MKFLVSNYSCLQNPWLGAYRPQILVLSVLCPQLNLLNPTQNKIPWYATGLYETYTVLRFLFLCINIFLVQCSKSNWPPAAVMPVRVKNSTTGAGSDSGKKPVYVQAPSGWNSARKRSSKPAWNLPVPNVQYRTPDDGQRRCPKHVEFYNRINLGK